MLHRVWVILHSTGAGLFITRLLIFLHNKDKVTPGTCVFYGPMSAACRSGELRAGGEREGRQAK